jgi:hypothetical protein
MDMGSIESLVMFLWTVGGPQSVSKNRFQRSIETIVEKFDHVLDCLNKLSADYQTKRHTIYNSATKTTRVMFSPHFHGVIGAIDGTHILVIVPSSATITHFGRYCHTTQNVMVVCDFDMRFTFVVAGWLGSVHDTRVFNKALQKDADKFSFLSEGINIIIVLFIILATYILNDICHKCARKYYLVDSGYANKKGFLSSYKRKKYHLLEFQGPRLVVRYKCLITYTHHYAM